MKIAKGPNGFRVTIRPNVQALADDICAHHPEFPRHWAALIERLKASGHLAGSPVDDNASHRYGVIQPFANGPRFRIAWSVVGDKVTVILGEF